jgi:hypothetical protein
MALEATTLRLTWHNTVLYDQRDSNKVAELSQMQDGVRRLHEHHANITVSASPDVGWYALE